MSVHIYNSQKVRPSVLLYEHADFSESLAAVLMPAPGNSLPFLS